jgi:putative MFS transporter
MSQVFQKKSGAGNPSPYHFSIAENTYFIVEETYMSTDVIKDPLQIAGRIERLPLCAFHYRQFLAHELCWIFASIGLATTTFLLPSLSSEYAFSSKTAGLVGTASFTGMFIGAGLAGMLGDRFGRKTILKVAIVLWGLASFLLAWSPNLTVFFTARVILGFGMGFHFPMTQSMLSEIMPAKTRGRTICLLEGGWPLSYLLSGCISYLMLRALGDGAWRQVFFIQGSSAIVAMIIQTHIPESARWFNTMGRAEEADTVVAKIEAKIKLLLNMDKLPEVPFIPMEQKSRISMGASFLELWSPLYRKRTFMVWVLWFTALLGFYGLNTWMSTLLVAKGFSVVKSSSYLILIALPSIPGYLTAAYLVEKLGRKPMMISYLLLAGLGCYLYGSAATFNGLIATGCFMQFFMFGMWSLLYTYPAEIYPSRARTTGCGFASSLGRFGALSGPYLVGVILTSHGPAAVFTLGAISLLIGATVVAAIGPETMGKNLEEINR